MFKNKKPGEKYTEEEITAIKDVLHASSFIETGFAIVFFVDEDNLAYKIMNPVLDSPLISLATKEERFNATKKSFETNKLISPDIYLETVSIYITNDDTLTLSYTDEMVVHAIKMRRLNDNDLLTLKLKQEFGPSSKMINVLAQLLVSCHVRLKQQEVDPEFNYQAALVGNFKENFVLIDEYFPLDQTILSRDEFDEIESKSLLMLEDMAVFNSRKDGDRVQRIHGDTHADNIFIEEECASLIDAVIPITRLSYGDVAIDVAALAMEFDAFGYHERADQLVEKYREIADDDIPDKVILFYKLYWAEIRLRVALSTLHNSQHADLKTTQETISMVERYKNLNDYYLGITCKTELKVTKQLSPSRMQQSCFANSKPTGGIADVSNISRTNCGDQRLSF